MENPADPVGPPRRLTDPRAMRALTHPVRLALIEVLTLHGTLTATAAGELIGETATTCSFHLRQLARYGFVEEAGGGAGRSRPWRLHDLGWSIDDPEGATAIAGDALVDLALDRMVSRYRAARAAARRRSGGANSPSPVPPPEMNETVWWVTADEFAELHKEIESLVYRFRDRLVEPARRPAGAVATEFVALTHVIDGPPPRLDSQGPLS